ncbi:hypothetical protein AWZ03_007578 [Drosophila navojoa]|uniref:Uncharacterized protein n=1 Tax=Drosophila navojoa TaxID=7232 RepID=A0A484BB58_DRONA|nr:hypothetical protein AWZ03_007578 [Drosophila navojoa]
MQRQHGSVPAAVHKKSRLPAGGSLHRCPGNDDVPRQQHANATQHLPDCGRRPTCIVFDEVDPIAVQDESCAPRSRPAVQHSGTQTEPSDDSKKRKVTIVETKQPEPREVLVHHHDPSTSKLIRSDVLPHERNEIKKPLSEYYYTSAGISRPSEAPVSTSTNRQPSVRSGYKVRNFIQTRDDPADNKSEPVASKQSAVKAVRFEDRSLFNLNKQNIVEGERTHTTPEKYLKHPTIVVPSEKKGNEQDERNHRPTNIVVGHTDHREVDKYYSCESISKMDGQFGRIKHQVDRLEVGVNELHANIALLKSKELGPTVGHVRCDPEVKNSRDLIVLYNEDGSNACGQSETDWKVYRIPKTAKHSTPASHHSTIDCVANSLGEPVKPSTDCRHHSIAEKSKYHTADRSLDPRIFTECKEHHDGCSFLIKPCNTPPKSCRGCDCKCCEPPIQLRRQSSNVCRNCSNRKQPVAHDLVCELKKLIGHRSPKDIQFSILLRADNVYHISVQLKASHQVLGCLLATNAAVQEAVNRGFFDDIRTYCAVDVRNTIAPIGRPLGIPFELMPRSSPRDKAGSEAEDAGESVIKLDSRTQEFITKVLGVPADRVAINLSSNKEPFSRLLIHKNVG